MAVYIELSPGDVVMIGRSKVRLERKSGQRARLAIESSEDIERIKAAEASPESKDPVSTKPIPYLKRNV